MTVLGSTEVAAMRLRRATTLLCCSSSSFEMVGGGGGAATFGRTGGGTDGLNTGAAVIALAAIASRSGDMDIRFAS